MSREKQELEQLKIEVASLKEQLEYKDKIIRNYIEKECDTVGDKDDVLMPLITLRNIFPWIARYCGILNVKNKLSDWLDIKPSVFHSLVLSKHRELSKQGIHQEDTKLSILCWIFLFIKAYESSDFQRYWRRLDPEEQKKKLENKNSGK